MYSKGNINIEDVLALNRVDSIFLTLEQIKDKYNVKLNFLEYASILNSIPKKITNYLQHRGSVQNIHNNPAVITFMYKVEKVICNAKGSRYVYENMIKKIYKPPEKIILKWKQELNVDESDVMQGFKNIYKSTVFIKLREFQYKMLHRYISLNDFLLKAISK